MKKLLTILFSLITVLSLTGCRYQKPEKYSIQELSIDSITTVCGTDCKLSDVNVSTTDKSCSASYQYTDVAEDRGILDAKKYHDYLKSAETCIKVEDFNEAAGSYTAYIGNRDVVESKQPAPKEGEEKSVAAGFSIKVSFTKDSYTVTMTDNVILDDILATK